MTTNNATYPPPQSAVKTLPMNITVPPPRRNENQLPHAWSIGTTRIAKETAQAPRRKEECPPEVYIG